MPQNLIVTIARQYGSGGREIGERLAELLGCKTYGNELTAMAAERSNMSEDALRRADDFGAAVMYTACPTPDGVGLAVYNRLLRAAAFEVITLD